MAARGNAGCAHYLDQLSAREPNNGGSECCVCRICARARVPGHFQSVRLPRPGLSTPLRRFRHRRTRRWLHLQGIVPSDAARLRVRADDRRLARDGQINSIAIQPQQHTNVMLGGSAGIVMSSTSGGTWDPHNRQLFATNATEMSLASGSGRVYIATDTRAYIRPSLALSASRAELMARGPILKSSTTRWSLTRTSAFPPPSGGRGGGGAAAPVLCSGC